ncbi:imelysin family protein [Paenibacillus farraposensis]|nr:imelysin family protein [Paenibacillus farraposensis]
MLLPYRPECWSPLFCSQAADKPELLSQQPAAATKDAGANTQATTPAATAPNFDQAAAAYRAYAVEQCDTFVEKTEEFTNTVKAGGLYKAKALYAPARIYYERIEPIAEALGELNLNIVARDGDVDAADWLRLPPY